MSDNFRVYTSPDPMGAELGAALKNVIALCAGITDGLGCGDNTKAMLMTRGLTETARLGVSLGAQKETFAGRYLYIHALPEPPGRHPHRSGQTCPGSHG